MSASDYDADLELALALSREDVGSAPAPSAGDDDDDDEYKELMRRAIAESLKGVDAIDSVMGSQAESSETRISQHATATAPGGDENAQQHAEVPMATTSQPSTLFGISQLDRKAMEQERLQRQGKRKRSVSPDRPSKLVAKPPAPPTSCPAIPTSLQYPKGAVKRTWAYKHPRTNDIQLEEVLQASTLNVAVLSSFQWEDQFLFHKADPAKIKQYWIMSAKGDDLQQKLRDELAECRIPNLVAHFPPMHGQIVNMHSKLMLLFHDTHLRIVIPTANMMKVEWGETGQDPKSVGTWQPAVMENSLFLIDLPRRLAEEQPKTSFGKELVSFLEAQSVSPRRIESLRKFDFSETDRFGFVHSIGGSHSDDAIRSRTGLHGLAGTIRQLKLDQVERLELDYAASSLGALTEDFLKQIYLAASGLSPLSNKAPPRFLDHFRIYFPTRHTVVNSEGGVRCGGIITLSQTHYKNPSFPRECLRDYKSTRRGVLSHNKLLLARGYKADGTPFAWAYLGSANISESAWGSQKMLKNGKEGVLSIRNWECGVVVPVPEEKLRSLERLQVPPMSVFDGTVEVPFQFPTERYGGKKPWFFME